MTGPGTGFVEDFNGNPDALNRFRYGVFYRDDYLIDQTSWPADHAFNGNGDCTGPDQTHTVQRDDDASHDHNHAESPTGGAIYLCESVDGDPNKGHLMTATGDTSGYSITWFSPDTTFTTETTVSWDMSVTNLGARQWVEVMLIPATGPDLACWADLPCFINPAETGWPRDAIVFGSGPLGGELTYITNGQRHVIGQLATIDPDGYASRTIRRNFQIRDTTDGLEFWFNGHRVATTPGSFPTGEWKVIFKDHDYTPHKAGATQYTWHFDNVVIQ